MQAVRKEKAIEQALWKWAKEWSKITKRKMIKCENVLKFKHKIENEQDFKL